MVGSEGSRRRHHQKRAAAYESKQSESSDVESGPALADLLASEQSYCFAALGATRATMAFIVVSVLHVLMHGAVVVVEVLGPFSTSRFNDQDQTWMRY